MLKKPDEMEKRQNEYSARNSFMFYTIALAIWTMVDLFKSNASNAGWELSILLIGVLIFFVSRKLYDRKMK